MRHSLLLPLAGLALLLLAGCDREATFKANFITHDTLDIACDANGTEIGRENPGDSYTFEFQARVLDQSWLSASQPYTAVVTFDAREISTGRVTHGITRTVQSDRVEPIEVNPWDFY